MSGDLPLTFPAGARGARAPYVTGAFRHDATDKIGDFPTPLWATRALLTHGPAFMRGALQGATVWEPFAGRGTMARPLAEFGPAAVVASDLVDYGAGSVRSGPQYDFRHVDPTAVGLSGAPDWIFTNPLFAEATAFWLRAWEIARVGVAMFLPLAFLAGEDRNQTIFGPGRMTAVCPFAERVPLFKGRLVRNGNSQALYAWYVGLKADPRPNPPLFPIPPCRPLLDRAEDWRGWPGIADDGAPLLEPAEGG